MVGGQRIGVLILSFFLSYWRRSILVCCGVWSDEGRRRFWSICRIPQTHINNAFHWIVLFHSVVSTSLFIFFVSSFNKGIFISIGAYESLLHNGFINLRWFSYLRAQNNNEIWYIFHTFHIRRFLSISKPWITECLMKHMAATSMEEREKKNVFVHVFCHSGIILIIYGCTRFVEYVLWRSEMECPSDIKLISYQWIYLLPFIAHIMAEYSTEYNESAFVLVYGKYRIKKKRTKRKRSNSVFFSCYVAPQMECQHTWNIICNLSDTVVSFSWVRS